MEWFLDNIIGMIGLLVGSFVAYHVYYLSVKTGMRDKLLYRDRIRSKVENLLLNISKGRNSKVELVNIKKYNKHYPDNNKKNRHGYTYIGAELKAIRYDGIEFFSGSPVEVYKNKDGGLSLKDNKEANKQDYVVFPVGIIPYEWVEYVETGGDEFSYRPQFFVSFKGAKKYPYYKQVYYIENKVHKDSTDPMDMKWRQADIKS